ncbi:MAG: TIGR00645 family protein, partial [Burkholderiales bacterium]
MRRPMDPNRETDFTHRQTSLLGSMIFASRWLQVPLYLGLIVAQGVYVVLFLE